jgi:hypothetical protein
MSDSLMNAEKEEAAKATETAAPAKKPSTMDKFLQKLGGNKNVKDTATEDDKAVLEKKVEKPKKKEISATKKTKKGKKISKA